MNTLALPPSSIFPRKLIVTLCCGLSLGLGFKTMAQGLSFEQTLQIALQQAPSLQARLASVQGATALQTSAGQLPDPKLSFGLDSLPVNGPNRGSLTRDDFTQRQIGYLQDVPNRAKRAARSDAAQARAEREQAMLQVERQMIRREAGLAWLAVYFVQARLELLEQHLAHQQVLLDTAPNQLATGKISAADVASLRIEALNLADQQGDLERDLQQAISQLQRWTGPAPAAASATPLSGPPPTWPAASRDLLQQLTQNPEVAALDPLSRMAAAEMREAQAAAQGDWSWSVNYGKRSRVFGDLASVQFTFELPIAPGQRQQPLVTARQNELTRIDAERDDLLRKLLLEAQTLLAEHDELQRQLARALNQALPLANQRVLVVLAAYESGKTTLAGVQEARIKTTDIQLRVLELQGRLAAAQWRLKTLTAEPSS